MMHHKQQVNITGNTNVQNKGTAGAKSGAMRDSYVSIHASGFKDFLLKPELLRAIMNCGFEHPSEGLIQKEKLIKNFIYLFYSST